MDPDSDSGGPKHTDPTDPNPQHCPQVFSYYGCGTYGTVPVSTELIFLDVELHVTKAFHVQKCGRGLNVDRGKSEESKLFREIFGD